MRERTTVFALAFVVGLVAGASVGWILRPAEWRANIWTTATAAADARRFGHAYESQAERVLLYPIYGGFVGTIAGLTAAAAWSSNRQSGAKPT